ILGTERHESRRIYNQLRGRAGRQGDPGESCFFISTEDDLMRIFGGDRIHSMMETMKFDEDMPIENKIISNTIESCQKKIEGRNFSIRKSVLDFDDVMSQQRETIYTQRAKVLNGEDVSENIKTMMKDYITENVEQFCQGDLPEDWNIEGLRESLMGYITRPDDLRYTKQEREDLRKEDLQKFLQDRITELYNAKEQEVSPQIMRELERVILLTNVDNKWMNHIDAMDELKKGIGLRSMGQKDPVVEYRFEGFAMFDEMIASIREDTVRMLLTVKVRVEAPPQPEQAVKPVPVVPVTPTPTPIPTPAPGAPVVKSGSSKKVGRNDPCPCGSGKKYKKCCGADE
ncbi:MAG: SEC-C domain-containing protein, partial [Ruminiclostridium sp.]|nr:SEC-C domain-containing protein [Ruminiclostridium sp.]